jgi:hypothetical protein
VVLCFDNRPVTFIPLKVLLNVIPSSLKKVIISSASNPRAAWAIVRNGAVAEFSIAADNMVNHYFDRKTNVLVADTQKARLKLTLDDTIELIVAETAAYRCSPWSQSVYLCIPERDAYMSRRKTLTHVSSHSEYQNGELWDIGIGNDSLDFCILVQDNELQQALKSKEGNYLLDDLEFLKELVKFSPQRLLKTKFASILVKQKIPVAGKEVVTGPHTHLLPNIICNNTKFPIPIDNNLCSIIQVDPFGSIIDGDGNYYNWAGFEKDPFQLLLEDYGMNNYIQNKRFLKDKILRLLYTNDGQTIIDEYSNIQNKDTVRIIIAQIACNKDFDLKIRKNAVSLLDTLKAINSHGLKEWARSQSTELLNE